MPEQRRNLSQLVGPKGRIYPSFSCQYMCPSLHERGIYCSAACYAIDGFDLAGNDYPPKCRQCGHIEESHPLDCHGRRICSVAIGELPSCVECAAPMKAVQERVFSEGYTLRGAND